MWLSPGRECFRKNQILYCQALSEMLAEAGALSFSGAMKTFPDGKIGCFQSPWYASPGRLAAMIMQVRHEVVARSQDE